MEGRRSICSYVRKKKSSTATKTKKQQNCLSLESKLCKICFTEQIINKCDTLIICVTNSTSKICKSPARKNLSKFINMMLDRRSIENDGRTTFNQMFNVIFLTLSRYFRFRVWFLKTEFS